jgi:hypothetical protein
MHTVYTINVTLHTLHTPLHTSIFDCSVSCAALKYLHSVLSLYAQTRLQAPLLSVTNHRYYNYKRLQIFVTVRFYLGRYYLGRYSYLNFFAYRLNSDSLSASSFTQLLHNFSKQWYY